jgi:hypothetical protein
MRPIRFVDMSAQRAAVREAVDAIIAESWFIGGRRVDAFERKFTAWP